MDYESDSELSITSPPDGTEANTVANKNQEEDPSTFKADGIYDQYTNARRKGILFLVASATFLLPVTDTVYLPSLTVVTI